MKRAACELLYCIATFFECAIQYNTRAATTGGESHQSVSYKEEEIINNPCENCKKRPNCPRPCFPLRDYKRSLHKKGKNKREPLIGNGWCVPVIEHIFKFLKEDLEREKL